MKSSFLRLFFHILELEKEDKMCEKGGHLGDDYTYVAINETLNNEKVNETNYNRIGFGEVTTKILPAK